MHQEIAALETLEQNPIKLFSLDDKSYGTIESRQSDYYDDSVRNVQDADDANSELATDDFHFEEKFQSEKIRSRNHDKIDDFPPPPPAAKTSYFEKNKPQKVENSLPKAWEKIRPVEKSEPVYPHPILFAMENKRNTSKPVHQEETTFQRQAVEQVTVRSEPDVNQFEPKYDDERPISGTGNYVIPDTDSTFGYSRQEQSIEQKIITEKQSFVQQPTVCETDTKYNPEPTAFPRDIHRHEPTRETFGALPAMKQPEFPAAPKRDFAKEQKSYTVEPLASREPIRDLQPNRSFEPSRDVQPVRQQELLREPVRQHEPVVRDYLKPKLDNARSVDRLLSKFGEKATENTESSYLSRPSDRRSSTSSNSSFQARM